MTLQRRAVAFLTSIGFHDGDKNDRFETDFVLADHQIRGGVLFTEYSCRFPTFRKLIAHVTQQLQTPASRAESVSEVEFSLRDNQDFESMVVYREMEVTKIWLERRKKI